MSNSSEYITARLEYLRGEIDAEQISWGEIAELQELAPFIDSGDVQLLEWAGVPEHLEVTRVPFDADLFTTICENSSDYYQTGWTVCGAEVPAVIYLAPAFEHTHPEYGHYTVCRVTEVYINSNRSDTYLEFSRDGITDAEHAQYETTTEGDN